MYNFLVTTFSIVDKSMDQICKTKSIDCISDLLPRHLLNKLVGVIIKYSANF